MLTSYTSYDQIRAVLGVSPKEITDGVLGQPLYESALVEALDELTDPEGTVTINYATVSAKPVDSRTSAETKFFNLVQMYAAYFVGLDALSSGPFSIPNTITDGKASVVRFEQRGVDPFAQLKLDIMGALTSTSTRLLKALGNIDGSFSAPEPVAKLTALIANGAFDPVAGA